jgi:hypothetical protein
VLKKSGDNIFGRFWGAFAHQLTDDRSLVTDLDSRVTDLSFLPSIGEEFFNTIGR